MFNSQLSVKLKPFLDGKRLEQDRRDFELALRQRGYFAKMEAASEKAEAEAGK